MSKIRLSLVSAFAMIALPGVAFAAHAVRCCGSLECCLRHLGCC